MPVGGLLKRHFQGVAVQQGVLVGLFRLMLQPLTIQWVSLFLLWVSLFLLTRVALASEPSEAHTLSNLHVAFHSMCHLGDRDHPHNHRQFRSPV